MVKAKVKFPNTVQEALVARRAKRAVANLIATSDAEAINEVIVVVNIWNKSGEAFDPRNPCMGQLSATSWNKKAFDFENLVVTQALVPMIKKGESGKQALGLFAKKLIDDLEGSTDSDVPEGCATVVVDLLTVLRCLQALLDENTDCNKDDISMCEDAATAINEASTLTRSRNMKTQIGVIIKNDDYYAKAFESFLTTRVKTMEFAPEIDRCAT
eukprot:1323997-Pyramimonas_sp.AAC.1